MSEAQEYLKRAKQAQKRWELWRSLHQEAMDYSAPSRETFNTYSPGQEKERHIFDSTAVLGLQQFANRIQSSIIPPWVNWMDLTAGDDIDPKEAEGVNKILSEVSKKFFSLLNHSNFYTEIAPSLIDLGIGTGAILIEEEEFGKTNAIRFQNVPLAELYPEKPAGGSIDSVWRKQKMLPKHIKRNWPEAKLTDKLQRMADNEAADEIEIWNGQCYNPKTGMYDHKVIYEPEKHILFEQEFRTKRLICFRWHVVPGEVYGRGPIIQQLADIRSANMMKEVILRNANIQMSGVYTGVSDGIFNPHTVRIAPASIIPVSNNNSANPSIQPLTPSGNIGLGYDLLSSLQDGIKKALFADPMGDLSDPVRSATEMMQRQQEMLKSSGASFGRLKTELIEPLVAAIMDVLQTRGEVPELRIDGREVTIKQQSPLAKAEQLEDFQNLQVWSQYLMGTLPPEVIAGSIKVEDVPKVTGKMLGIPAELMRTDEERDELAQQVNEAAQAGLEQGGIDQGGQI